LYIKLHPKDDKNNYIGLFKNIEFIEDFGQAINGNICIARKSTILVEALYNQSESIAIVINNKDKQIFDKFISLQDSRIKKIYNLEDIELLEITN